MVDQQVVVKHNMQLVLCRSTKEEQVISKEQRIIVKLLNENFGEKGLSNDRCPIRQDSIS